jgi:hypothetical protein
LRYITREFIQLTIILVVLFLILTHASGFSRGVGALAGGYSRMVRTLQGR